MLCRCRGRCKGLELPEVTGRGRLAWCTVCDGPAGRCRWVLKRWRWLEGRGSAGHRSAVCLSIIAGAAAAADAMFREPAAPAQAARACRVIQEARPPAQAMHGLAWLRC